MAKADVSKPEGLLPLDKFQFPPAAASDDDDDSEPRRLANTIMLKIQYGGDDLDNLPEALLELLTKVIKPLFSSGHSRVTPAGRKPAYAPPSMLANSPWSTTSLDVDEDEQQPAWRLPLTVPLLAWILKAYRSLRPPQKRRQVLDSHFPLLIPPILKLIDDMPSTWRAAGFSLLHLLCDSIEFADSDILKRTGLIDVCFDAIKSNFMLLPTLTPEEESLQVLQQLYPASLGLVRARFRTLSQADVLSKDEKQNEKEKEEEEGQRQKYLKIILRHGLLASLTHLGVGLSSSSSVSVSHVSLTTFLLSQLIPTIKAMGLAAVVHLNRFVPILRSILIDPFVLSVPELPLTALDVMETMMQTCTPRITDMWWSECLYSLVGCWCNIIDDDQNKNIQKLKDKTRAATQALSRIVNAEQWQQAVITLCNEEEDVKGLFAP